MKINTCKNMLWPWVGNSKHRYLMWTPAQGICVLWLRRRNSHGLQKSCGEKGTGRATLSERDKAQTSAWTGFCCFSGHITWRMVLIHYAQVALGGYLLQITKERKLLITTEKKDICKCKGKSGRTGYTLSLGGLAYILGSYFKDMQ